MRDFAYIKIALKRVILFSAISLLVPLSLSAQRDSNLSNENFFFKAIRANQADSYITFGQGFGNMEPLIFEALISPYFLLRTSKDSRWGATLSPAIMIRMYSEKSLPVRTPSYMPHITFYHQISRRATENVKYLFLNLAHHSNGQDGEFFNNDGTFNVNTGNFATNYLEFGMFLNKHIVPFTNTNEYFRTSLEYHLDVGHEKELKGRYSNLRWHNNLRIFRFPSYKSAKRLILDKTPAIQTRIETTWMFGNFNDASFFDIKERLNFSFTIAFKPKFLTDVSLFANIYIGQDYYNMHFYRRISLFRVGLQAYSFK